MSFPPGPIIVSDWHRCPDSREFFSRILHNKKRRKFGLLEAPMMPPHMNVDMVCYKVFISGKTGVGESALAALELHKMHYETMRVAFITALNNNSKLHIHTGVSIRVIVSIETTVFFWPVRLKESGRVLFFRFELWDCGESALIVAPLMIFQIRYHGSQNLQIEWLNWSLAPNVTESDVTHFQEVCGLPIFRVGGDVSEVAPLLNALAENLWHQDCMAASSVFISTQAALRETDSEIIV